jgi:hypothetical protein
MELRYLPEFNVPLIEHALRFERLVENIILCASVVNLNLLKLAPWERAVCLHAFLIWATDGGDASVVIPKEAEPSDNYWIKGCVNPRAGLDLAAKKTSVLAGNQIVAV